MAMIILFPISKMEWEGENLASRCRRAMAIPPPIHADIRETWQYITPMAMAIAATRIICQRKVREASDFSPFWQKKKKRRSILLPMNQPAITSVGQCTPK